MRTITNDKIREYFFLLLLSTVFISTLVEYLKLKLEQRWLRTCYYIGTFLLNETFSYLLFTIFYFNAIPYRKYQILDFLTVLLFAAITISTVIANTLLHVSLILYTIRLVWDSMVFYTQNTIYTIWTNKTFISIFCSQISFLSQQNKAYKTTLMRSFMHWIGFSFTFFQMGQQSYFLAFYLHILIWKRFWFW